MSNQIVDHQGKPVAHGRAKVNNVRLHYVGAQVPYDQGVAEALATLKSLLGESTPQWIVLPALPVLPKNVLEGYRQVFHAEPPAELAAACKTGQAQ